MIEQPELHLHPTTQSRLPMAIAHGLFKDDEFADAPCGYMGSEKSNTSFLIETHSEHIVRGFQVLVAKKVLEPEDVIIHYVDKDEHGFGAITRIELDKHGFFKTPWPLGFFDIAYIQSLELIAEKN